MVVAKSNGAWNSMGPVRFHRIKARGPARHLSECDPRGDGPGEAGKPDERGNRKANLLRRGLPHRRRGMGGRSQRCPIDGDERCACADDLKRWVAPRGCVLRVPSGFRGKFQEGIPSVGARNGVHCAARPSNIVTRATVSKRNGIQLMGFVDGCSGQDFCRLCDGGRS